jgi:transposase InsO family protein
MLFPRFWLRILTTMPALLLDDHARRVVDYLREENLVLRECLRRQSGSCRIPLTDAQRRRLASRSRSIGRNLLGDVTDLFSPDTLLKWYRQLIARKYDSSAKRKSGRPPLSQERVEAILRLARDNPSWGFGRIQNYMRYLGLPVSRTTVRRVLHQHGISPDPRGKPKTTWNEFLRSHLHVMAATDFFSVELLTPRGLVRCMVLFVIDVASRRVQIAGVRPDPNGCWMEQIARNLTFSEDGFLWGKRYLIHDRDPLFSQSFRDLLKAGGITPLRLPRHSPNLNAYAERFVQTVRRECLDRLIVTSPRQLEYVLREFVAHYHRERPHEGLEGRMIAPHPNDPDGDIVQFDRLGGLLKSYRRLRPAA